MPTVLAPETLALLRDILRTPCLTTARALDAHLRDRGFRRQVFGRINQKSSIDAASESDRGITERVSNAFDASLTAARRLAGFPQSDPAVTPRIAAQRYLCPDPDACEWVPQLSQINFNKPVLEFWPEGGDEKNRFRKYNPGDGLATVLVRDNSLGIQREKMRDTILNLNSDDKLRTFEAIGQFGHGGSSALSFCESCLILTQPRFSDERREFYWTLIVPEREDAASKQSLIRRWFADQDELPLVASLDEFPGLKPWLPGTSIYHFGYNRGGWINRIAGPEQKSPWGRLGRLFFSYPLPFEIRGKFARTDSEDGRRNIKGAFFRLLEKVGEKLPTDKQRSYIEYPSPEKSEVLEVDGEAYGTFSVFVFVLAERQNVRDYVDPEHPLILTLNRQNHGEMTRTVFASANLPETSSSMIVEVRLDKLDQEALGEIISNSREAPKNTAFTRALRDRITKVLAEDEVLRAIETRRQEEKARQSSADLNQKITKFLSSIISDAVADPSDEGGGDAPGGGGGGGGPPRPEIPAADPPKILEFLSEKSVLVPEGTALSVKFKSDARPPKYSFHGDNPRCFVRFEPEGLFGGRISVSGKSDINPKGYGAVRLSCGADANAPIESITPVGKLYLSIQCADGRQLQAALDVGVRPKPRESERKRKQAVKPVINFCAPEGEDRDELARLIAEEQPIGPFGAFLDKYCSAIRSPPAEAAYWGEKSEKDGASILSVEINAAHPRFRRLFETCRTVEEKILIKERFVRDVVLDCYQHSFRLDDLPDAVHERVVGEVDEPKRAAEICLNHDKALRIALHERDKSRS
jgi:hypothetical protein